MNWALVFLTVSMSALPLAAQREPDPLDQNVKTGPGVGERIPAFRAVDHKGRRVDFNAIRGPRGAALLFHRSADW